MELRSTGYGGASSVVLSKMERRSLHRIHMSSGETDMSPFMRPVDLRKRKEKPREKRIRKKKRRILCGVVGTPHTLMFSFVKFARNTGIFGGMGKNKNFNVVIPRIVRWVSAHCYISLFNPSGNLVVISLVSCSPLFASLRLIQLILT